MSHRTTLTLDDDVAEALALESRRTGRSHREVVNAAIRRGMGRAVEDEPFRVVAKDMHRRPGVEIDDIEGLLDILDGHTRR